MGVRAAAGLLAAAAAIVRGPEAVPSAGCGKATALPRGEPTPQELALPSGTRSYVVTLPAGYSPDRPYPVVFGFHGWGLSGDDLRWYDGSAKRAEKEGKFISVHPDGAQDAPSGRRPWRAWSAVGSSMSTGASDSTCDAEKVGPHQFACYTSCGSGCSRCSWASCADDVGFVETLLNLLEDSLCIDQAQVRAHGESNGGMLIWQLLQSPVAERFASLVSVIGSPGLGTQLPPKAPVRFLGLWGSKDQMMPARSLDLHDPKVQGYARSRDGFYYETAINATAKVATSYGCVGSAPWPTSAKGVTCVHFPGCADARSEVVHCTFEGIHDWPSDATDLIYRFYERKSEDVALTQKTPLLRRSPA